MTGWSKNWGRDKICPITQTRLRPGSDRNGNKYVIKISCGHRFYRNALNKWLKYANNCPVCRKEIKIEK